MLLVGKLTPRRAVSAIVLLPHTRCSSSTSASLFPAAWQKRFSSASAVSLVKQHTQQQTDPLHRSRLFSTSTTTNTSESSSLFPYHRFAEVGVPSETRAVLELASEQMKNVGESAVDEGHVATLLEFNASVQFNVDETLQAASYLCKYTKIINEKEVAAIFCIPLPTLLSIVSLLQSPKQHQNHQQQKSNVGSSTNHQRSLRLQNLRTFYDHVSAAKGFPTAAPSEFLHSLYDALMELTILNNSISLSMHYIRDMVSHNITPRTRDLMALIHVLALRDRVADAEKIFLHVQNNTSSASKSSTSIASVNIASSSSTHNSTSTDSSSSSPAAAVPETSSSSDTVTSDERGLANEMSLDIYNIFIRGYARLGDVKNTRRWWSNLAQSGLKPDGISCGNMILAYAMAGDIKRARVLFKQAMTDGLLTEYGWTMYMRGCLAGHDYLSLIEGFQSMNFTPQLHHYTLLIRAHGENMNSDGMLRAVADLRNAGLQPDINLYLHTIELLGKLGKLEAAVELYESCRSMNLAASSTSYSSSSFNAKSAASFSSSLLSSSDFMTDDPFEQTAPSQSQSYNDKRSNSTSQQYSTKLQLQIALMHAHAWSKDIEGVYRIFAELLNENNHRYIRVFEALLLAHACKNDPIGAKTVLDELRSMNLEPTRQAWDAVASAFANVGDVQGTDEIVRQAKSGGVGCTLNGLVHQLRSLAVSGNADAMVQLAFEKRKQLEASGQRFTAPVYNALIDGLVAAGRLEAAELVFYNMDNDGVPRDPQTYEALLCGYALSGRALSAVDLLSTMKTVGVGRGPVAYRWALEACIAARKWPMALELQAQIEAAELPLVDGLATSLLKMYTLMYDHTVTVSSSSSTPSLSSTPSSSSSEQQRQQQQQQQQQPQSIKRLSAIEVQTRIDSLWNRLLEDRFRLSLEDFEMYLSAKALGCDRERLIQTLRTLMQSKYMPTPQMMAAIILQLPRQHRTFIARDLLNILRENYPQLRNEWDNLQAV